MNRSTFNAMLGQYAVQELTGEGHVSWENGAHCVIPKVEIRGKAVQDGTPSPDNPIDPVFAEGTAYRICGRNLVKYSPNPTWMGYCAKVNQINDNTFEVIRNSETIHGGYGEVRIDGLPLNKLVRIVVTAKSEYEAYESRNASCLFWLKSNSGQQAGVAAVYLTVGPGYDDAIVVRTYTTKDTHLIFGCYPNRANNGESVVFQFSVYLEEQADDSHEDVFDGGTATCPETLMAIPDTEYYDTWDPQTGKGIRRCAAIESYAGETIDTPYISSTGELSEGAYVVYGIPDTPFTTDPQPLIQPKGVGNIIQTAGTVDTPITVKCVTHS